MGEVRSINALRATRENDNSLLTPVEALEDAAADLRSGERKANKMVAILLNAEDDDYHFGFVSSNMRVSEMVALLEAAKTRLLRTLVGDDS